MSRSKSSHSSKGPGYEYWSKRPGTDKGAQSPGRWSKKVNVRLERIQGKNQIKKQLEDVDGR